MEPGRDDYATTGFKKGWETQDVFRLAHPDVRSNDFRPDGEGLSEPNMAKLAYGALFGGWLGNSRIPGLLELFRKHENTDRWAIRAGGAMLAIIALHTLGVPTDIVFKTLSRMVGLP